MSKPSFKMGRHFLLGACLVLAHLSQISHAAQGAPSQRYASVKTKGFRDGQDSYKVTSFNATQMPAQATHRSMVRVSRVQLDPTRTFEVGPAENIQTLHFNPSLVDFDLHCTPLHCYLVCVTSRSKRNVQLYRWTRTQFDLQAQRDSFARAHSVRLFSIEPASLYIALAQDQLHLTQLYRHSSSSGDNFQDEEDEEPTRFIGAAVFKFTRGQERKLAYHQFIRLPFNPLHVHHYKSLSSNNLTQGAAIVQPFESHYLVFSREANWADSASSQPHSFIWSAQNDRFWPYRMPRGAEVEARPLRPAIKLPGTLPLGQPANLTLVQDYLAPVESCFYQLERLLADRDHQQRQLLDSSRSVWRAPNQLQQQQPQVYQTASPLTNITAQVVVLGNVTVLGSLIESPQVTLFDAPPGAAMERVVGSLSQTRQLAGMLRTHSPALVENKIQQALFKLNYIREKLARAVLANLPPASLSSFNNQVRLLGGIEARQVHLAGVANSNVRLNGLPFRQLENELVSLSGAQDIGTRVVFDGRVVADVLEIHGQINDHFYLRDALDITSRRVQVIETSGGQSYAMRAPGMVALDFASLSAPEVILAHNTSINSIHLGDFITRDNRTQLVHGVKTFRRLSMARLDLAHSGVTLNGHNLTHVARQAIRLRAPATEPALGPGQQLATQSLGAQASFAQPLRVGRLTFNQVINHHINLSALIHDSVKTNDMGIQQIFGQKNFLAPLRINRLTAEGSLNGILVSQVFNLNPGPPTADHYRYVAQNASYSGGQPPLAEIPIEGKFKFAGRSYVLGSMSAVRVNGVDLARRAVQRAHSNASLARPQLVRGHKTFYMPLRVVNRARIQDPREIESLQQQQQQQAYGPQVRGPLPYPLVNGIDLRLIAAGLDRQMRAPSLINVDTLEIDGNLDIPSASVRVMNQTARTTLGSYLNCPLDAIRRRSVLAGLEDQLVEVPLRVNSLRAKSILLDSGPLNDFNFPQDFVLRTSPLGPSVSEPIHGVKSIEHLVVSPPSVAVQHAHSFAQQSSAAQPQASIVLGRSASINHVPQAELQAFVAQERKHGATGEKVFNTLNVYGNLYAKRINEKYWPDDILLRSMSSSRGAPPSPFQHKRIYSHLVFANTSQLQVEQQLVLRGPIQLEGRMNGVNLTEFSRQSATYYDKDLYATGRPLRNKIFLGGVSVRGEIRSQGLVDGVNFDEMRRRVVSVEATPGQRALVSGAKMFLSDVTFQAPVTMLYLNELPIDHHLRRIRFEPDGTTLKVFGKKSITGALRINRNLYVRGLINGVDFAELRARAISLSAGGELTFNKTLTVEGDVFMDNLWIDERNGTIDGVRLTNLLPIGTLGKNELILTEHHVDRRADPYGRVLRIDGALVDCQVACDLHERPAEFGAELAHAAPVYRPSPSPGVVVGWPGQAVFAGTSRPALSTGREPLARNFTLTRTTPPYSLSASYQPPMPAVMGATQQQQQQQPILRPASRQQHIQQLFERRPAAITYERSLAPGKRHMAMSERTTTTTTTISGSTTTLVVEQLDILRKHIISTSVVHLSSFSHLVVGFIEAPTNELASYELPEPEESHADHAVRLDPNYLQLDQTDVPIGQAIHSHLSVGVATNRIGNNITSVYSSLGGRNLTELSVLPVSRPNAAKFVILPRNQVLLLISQDYSIGAEMCPAREPSNQVDRPRQQYQQQYYPAASRTESGVHVYLFHILQNTSSLASAYFDLYQTIDLQGIDSFEKFTHRGSSYVLAISRSRGKIYLLLMRGYTAYQLVSDVDAPGVERVSVMFAPDKKPVLVVHQTSGLHRVLEAVII